MTRAGLSALIALLLTLAAGDGLLAGSLGQSEAYRLQVVSAWADAVERHDGGTIDGALMHVADLSADDLQRLWLDVQVLLGFMGHRTPGTTLTSQRGNRRRPVPASPLARGSRERDDLRKLAERLSALGPNGFVLRAAWLHTDVILLVEADPDLAPSSAGSARLVTKVNDGEVRGRTGSPAQWDFARALIETIRLKPSENAHAKAWYQATMAYMLNGELYDMLHAQRAIYHFPDDPTILFQLGCLHEVLATEPVQRARRNVALPAGVTFGVSGTDTELDLAEAFLRRALELDPSRVEARVHFGRVIGVRGRHPLAAEELRRAAAEEAEPVVTFHADLFLGAEEEALGRPTEARAAYARANARFPDAQSAQIAMSQLARTSGRRAEALSIVERILTRPHTETDDSDDDIDDPWWTYYRSPGGTRRR